MKQDVIYEDEIFFYDEDFFEDSEEHTYNCECHDGVAYCDLDDDLDAYAPRHIKVTYPKLAEVLADEDMVAEVKRYRGLDASCEIHYGDIMMKYGTIVNYGRVTL